MIYDVSLSAVLIFVFFVTAVVWLSFWLARKTKSAHSYFAAGGTIHWGVNGIAFAGDYLSAASFLGICGMIATVGYDGFLYSIGYLAGWVVALFLVAEPLKRLGRYTFTDALNSKFQSPGVQLAAAVSTLIVSVCYLIPQMVGAGDLVTPLLGLPHYIGVIMVGSIVILIVATAGMTSTTYVQFIKGGMLIICSILLTLFVLQKGLKTRPSDGYHEFQTVAVTLEGDRVTAVQDDRFALAGQHAAGGRQLVKLLREDVPSWWTLDQDAGVLREALSISKTASGAVLYNGAPKSDRQFFPVGHAERILVDGEPVDETGAQGPLEYLATIGDSTIIRFTRADVQDGADRVAVYSQTPTPGSDILRPGLKIKIDKGATLWSKLNFISLMMALFFGTSALPHILIRYYTVPSARDARKSTIMAIAAIGFFYILTLYMGLGAMTNGVLDMQSDNMSAPLLAKSFGLVLFAIISALAFATILGTVSGLIVASSGAVAHDLMDRYFKVNMSDRGKVMAGKVAAIVVGVAAILLGILFKGMNVSFLVGLAFSVAASANLPAIIMLLFWKHTTSKGVAASIIVGIISSLAIILLSPSLFELYGLGRAAAPTELDNPGIISIPLSFITLVVVSLATRRKEA
ncbi:MAG TPA: cation acetate symporter [Kiritimatiellia bacterium]|nr:cation acetate symporter [Kiritimatiellia bacterium]